MSSELNDIRSILNHPISKHFILKEAILLPEIGVHHNPSMIELVNITRLAEKMEGLRSLVGDLEIIVHCWIRPTEINCLEKIPLSVKDYNHLVGGAPKSAHITGSAVDFHVKGYEGPGGCAHVRRKIIECNFLNINKLRMEDINGGWIHIDNTGCGTFKP